MFGRRIVSKHMDCSFSWRSPLRWLLLLGRGSIGDHGNDGIFLFLSNGPLMILLTHFRESSQLVQYLYHAFIKGV